MYELIAQAIGIIAMMFNILSFQQKTKKGIIALQLFGTLLFSVSYLMLGYPMPSCLNIIAMIRAIVYLRKERTNTERIIRLSTFCLLFACTYIINFTVFNTEPSVRNFIIEALPLGAMISSSFGFAVKTPATLRKLNLICSPLWLIYNIIAVAIGGIICETFSIISIIIAVFRYDIKRKKAK